MRSRLVIPWPKSLILSRRTCHLSNHQWGFRTGRESNDEGDGRGELQRKGILGDLESKCVNSSQINRTTVQKRI